MNPDLRAALRTLAEALPSDTPVPVPAGTLIELLNANGDGHGPAMVSSEQPSTSDEPLLTALVAGA